MNERIQDLYREAEKSVAFVSNSTESKQLIIREKFAELIVQECASIVYKTCQDGDAGAQAILYEFDIDNARSQK